MTKAELLGLLDMLPDDAPIHVVVLHEVLRDVMEIYEPQSVGQRVGIPGMSGSRVEIVCTRGDWSAQ